MNNIAITCNLVGYLLPAFSVRDRRELIRLWGIIDHVEGGEVEGRAYMRYDTPARRGEHYREKGESVDRHLIFCGVSNYQALSVSR